MQRSTLAVTVFLHPVSSHMHAPMCVVCECVSVSGKISRKSFRSLELVCPL